MKILNILIIFATYINVFLVIQKISELKNESRSLTYFFAISCVVFVSIMSTRMFDELYKGIISFLNLFLLTLAIKKCVSKETFVITFISYAYLAVCETIFAVSFFIIGQGDFIKKSSNLGLNKLLVSLAISIVMLGIVKIKCINKLIITLKKRLTNYKYLLPIIMLISFLFEISTIFTMMNTSNKREVILSFSLMILIGICICLLWYNIYKKNYLKLINENLMISNETFMNIINKYKMFKHNITSELATISEIGDKKVKKLVSEYLKEHQVKNKYDVSSIANVPTSLKNLVYQKILEHETFNINLMVENLWDTDIFETISIKKICKLVQCMGIVFDNAIEASNSIEDGYVYLRFYKEKTSGYYVVECHNNFCNHIEIDNYSNPITSKKENHHGIGVSYLFKQKDVMVKSNIINNNFVVKMYVK